jgi:hypothetical protein
MDSKDLRESPEPITMTAKRRNIERRMVRKVDLTLMPMTWVLYLFNYLDRNSISQAKLTGIEDDLGLVGNQFNTAISILNVGYVPLPSVIPASS